MKRIIKWFNDRITDICEWFFNVDWYKVLLYGLSAILQFIVFGIKILIVAVILKIVLFN